MRYVTTRVGLFVAASLVSGVSFAELSGQIGLDYGQRLDSNDRTETGVIARAKYQYDWSNWSIHAEGRFRYNDAACSAQYNSSVCSAYRQTHDWRELYASYQHHDWQWDLGLQQIVWGRADNLRLLDLVNPVDYRDFVLPDLNDYRRAVPAARLTHQVGSWSLEALYLPHFVANRYAASGSEFDFKIDQQFAQQGLVMLAEQRPAGGLKQAEWGGMASTTLGSLDLSLMLLSSWSDDPVYQLDYHDLGWGQQPVVRPVYARQHHLGGSLAYSLDGGWIIRSEATYAPDAIYSRSQDDDWLVRSATTSLLLGLDYNWKDWLFTGQITDRHIESWDSSYLVPEHAASLTLSATGNSLSAKLNTRIALSWMPQQGDGLWWQLKSTYKPNDHWALEASLDLLNGRASTEQRIGGFFGQFRDRDRLYLESRWFF